MQLCNTLLMSKRFQNNSKPIRHTKSSHVFHFTLYKLASHSGQPDHYMHKLLRELVQRLSLLCTHTTDSASLMTVCSTTLSYCSIFTYKFVLLKLYVFFNAANSPVVTYFFGLRRSHKGAVASNWVKISYFFIGEKLYLGCG